MFFCAGSTELFSADSSAVWSSPAWARLTQPHCSSQGWAWSDNINYTGQLKTGKNCFAQRACNKDLLLHWLTRSTASLNSGYSTPATQMIRAQPVLARWPFPGQQMPPLPCELGSTHPSWKSSPKLLELFLTGVSDRISQRAGKGMLS